MTLNVRMQSSNNRLKPRITVIGVGGAGGNAVNNMISSGLEGCEFLVCNTDAQALEGSRAAHKIQLGANVTRGLGAGANPEIGGAAAEESLDDILAYLEGSNMVFVTAGMGGGTGTGAAPVIAQAAREAGILTVGVVTKPFHFEGTHRMRLAENGITELQKYVDTLIIIPNQNLFRIANEKTTFSDAFRMADEVLQSGVRGVTDLMVMPGLINLDFADIRAVMAEMGKAMMGTGEAEGERRAVEAAEAAISNPLLDDVSMKGAKGVLINITGGLDMTLFEVDEAANRIRDEVDPDANIIFGSTFDQALQGKMRVSVVATGIEANAMAQPRPLHLAGSQVEPARRSTVGGGAQRPATQQSYAQQGQGFSNPGFASQGGYGRGDGFGGGSSAVTPNLSVPAGIVPGGRPTFQPTARAAQQTVAAAPQTVDAGASRSFDAGASWNEPTVGHAAGVQAAPVATATARKLQESELTTKPAAPVTQSYQRNVPPASQPRAQRHGDSFIPPKPVDPKSMTHAGADLFGEPVATAAVAAPAAPAAAAPVKRSAAPIAAPAEKAAPKKSPSLFERFTLRREEPAVTAPARSEAASKLTVEEGGKKDEDELDIPAFLRRQAN